MPKVTGTRKQKAQELLERLRRGPASIADSQKLYESSTKGFGSTSPKDSYRIWFESWVENQLIELVPELKNAKTTG